jgi:hypothetical protein
MCLLPAAATCSLHECSNGKHASVLGPKHNTSEWAIVFQVDLLLFYTPLGFGKLGESWSRFSLIQAVG